MLDVIVVGAGLFGQVITAELRRLGMHVEMIDAKRPHSGSSPSASLMKPSWFSSMGAAATDPALETLDRLYGVGELQFRVGPLKMDGVKWCNPRQILAPLAIQETVTSAGPGEVWTEWTQPGSCPPRLLRQRRLARHVILATGKWTGELRHVPGLEAKMGLACWWPDVDEEYQNFIAPWAPYKQLVGFKMNGGVWVGDGSAIKEANWKPERWEKTVDRCSAVGPRHGTPHIAHGARPYVPKKHLGGRPCFLEQVNRIWVATGGAKNGTVAAGWAAWQLGRMLS